ncbi:MAG: hypothetical protein K2O70_03190, partial [Desulfovibrionaceae bacterium]|nr:hypothetical protein [Desulfovibrionaceae bacterium]
DQQLAAVEGILADMELDAVPRLLILNKWDRLDAEQRALLLETWPEALPVAALTGEGMERVLRELERCLIGTARFPAVVYPQSPVERLPLGE